MREEKASFEEEEEGGGSRIRVVYIYIRRRWKVRKLNKNFGICRLSLSLPFTLSPFHSLSLSLSHTLCLSLTRCKRAGNDPDKWIRCFESDKRVQCRHQCRRRASCLSRRCTSYLSCGNRAWSCKHARGRAQLSQSPSPAPEHWVISSILHCSSTSCTYE